MQFPLVCVTDDDVIDLDDLTPPSPMDATPPSSQSDQRDGSYNHPRAIRCEDGGYLIDPSTISTSPIRSFKRIDDLAPEQRAGFQNQFQGKQGGGRRRSSRGGQGVNSWTGRDDFDELLGKLVYVHNLYVCMYICMYVHVCMCVCVHACMCVCKC